MKKIFLAALTALALCSYSYAQDDVYEEDSPRAAAAAEPSYSSHAKASHSDGDAFMGINLNLADIHNPDRDSHNLPRIGLVFKLAPNMELSAILGLFIFGDEDGEDTQGNKVKGREGFARVSIGAGFDYIIPTFLLPISLGGNLLFTHFNEDDNMLNFDVMFGLRAEIIKNFFITGKVGPGLDFHWWTDGRDNNEYNTVDFGFKTSLNFTWFFM